MQERLQKVLAAAGVASRRKSEELISSGKVSVDGRVVTELGTKIDPDKQTVAVNGVNVQLSPKKYYILLNKPKGYTSTRSDPHARHLVTELIKEVPVPLHPVGRLDVDTEGLLILTNDGEFTYTLTHPKHAVPKTYVATVFGIVTFSTVRQLEQGIELEDGKTFPAKARLVRTDPPLKTSVVELTITEGRKRQVRRMFQAVGHRVVSLVRVKIDGIELGRLNPGTWRNLTEQEVERLKKAGMGRK
jgi:23S rRNA pseudouridine2605 synthase